MATRRLPTTEDFGGGDLAWPEMVQDEPVYDPSGGGGYRLPPGGGGGVPQDPKPTPVPEKNPFNYEQARDSWMSGQYGGGKEGAAAWAKANGVDYNGSDTINLPNGGGFIDIIGNYAGGAGNGRPMTNNWTPAGFNGPNPGGQGQSGYGQSGQGASGQFGSSSYHSGNPHGDEIWAAIKGLLPGGGWNQNRVNSRTESAREDLNRYQKSQNDSNRATLASRGLLGSGPEATAQSNLEGRIADQYSNQVRNIYNDESQQADAQAIAALQAGVGLSESEARGIIDLMRANTERDLGFGNLDLNRMLGQGNLALGNMRAVNDYNMGLANYGLDRDQLLYQMEHGDTNDIMSLIQQLFQGAQTSAGGFI